MKKLLLIAVAVLGLTGLVNAQSIPSDLTLPELTAGGIPKLIGDKVKELRGCALVDFQGHKGGGAYLPIWSLQSEGGGVTYAHAMNVGYRALEGKKPNVLIMPLALNLTAVSGKVWDFDWARKHVARSPFPPVFVGPTILLPINGPEFQELTWAGWKSWAGVVLSVGLK